MSSPSRVRRILFGDGSLGTTVGTLLFIGLGLALIWLGAAALSHATRSLPVPRWLSALASLSLGIGLLTWGLMPIARRWRLEKESDAP